MDVSHRNVRVEERLRIHIGEAKNLPSRSHGSVGQRDTYCAISVNQEEIFKTSTVEKNLSPFFGEEFNFEIPPKFRFLSIYVHDQDNKKDKIIGKVSIKKENLHKYNGKDHWFPILNVDADSEVQGKVHVDVKIGKSVSHGGIVYKLLIKILECNDLQIIQGACDPYVVMQLSYSFNKPESKRTKVKKKTICPQYDETFIFDLPVCVKGDNHEWDVFKYISKEMDPLELKIEVLHDSSVFGSMFLGEVKIPLHCLDLKVGHNAWYFLQPRQNKSTNSDLGSLRLKLYYTSDHVFSSHFYKPLKDLLLLSPKVQPITSSAGYVLGEIVSNKTEAALPLVKVFLHYGQIVPFLTSLAKYDMSHVTDSNTVFRGNTLMSKCMDEFMKLAGLHYLHNALKPIINQILLERKSCEIDPGKLKEGECIRSNLQNLMDYTTRIFEAIKNSALVCPYVMCEVFAKLKEQAMECFCDSPGMRYVVISGFIFLRFFAPAILGPKLFELSTESIDVQTLRTLTLISKSIQTLGNHVRFSTPPSVFKEDYMTVMYKEFVTTRNVEAMQKFLDIISSVSSNRSKYNDSPIILKESVMIKRAQGRRIFKVRNFKRRYFCLTTHELTYSKSKGSTALCTIPIKDILAVEKLEEDSFSMKNMFQIVQGERALYVQANNCVELKCWIDLINKVIQSNKNKLSMYHPGAFVNGHWLCCRQSVESTSGCKPVSLITPDLTVKIDSDREIERIHSLFLSNMDKVEKLCDACEREAVYTGEETTSVSNFGFDIEDTHSLWETLKAIMACVISLEQDHKQHQRAVNRLTKYGSEQAPIGDDNYLLSIAQTSL